MLGGLDVAMAKHGRDRLDGDAIAEGDGGGECMARHMEGQGFGNPTNVSNLLEVGIGFLVGTNR